jgi:hypothetical protein
MFAVQNMARQILKHQKNYDNDVYRHLYKILVEGMHKLKINPKHLPYNSIHHDLKTKVENPKSKCQRHMYLGASMDGNLKTENNRRILNEINRLVELNAVSVFNHRQNFEGKAPAMFPDPALYPAFKITQEGKVMKSFMKQLYDVGKKYGLYPQAWIVEHRKEHRTRTYLHCSKRSGSG